jgi:hypothetical protein
MSTNPKSYAGFQGKYPLLVTLDSDGTPPMLERIESKSLSLLAVLDRTSPALVGRKGLSSTRN